ARSGEFVSHVPSECVLPAMDREQEEAASVPSSPTDNPVLNDITVEWIEEESNLICDLATIDATFDVCNIRQSRNQLNSDDSYLFEDFLTRNEPSKSQNSIILSCKDDIQKPKRASLFKKIDRNAMAVSLLAVFLFSFFFDAKSNPPAFEQAEVCSNAPDNFAGNYFVKDRDQAYHVHHSVHSQTYNLIFVYSHMSLRSRKWIKIINKMERMMRYDRKFGFYTCRCFETNDSCQRVFGVQAKTPAVVLYHKGRYYHYAGRLSIDHVWSWLERMMSPVEIVYDLEDYYQKFLKYDITFTAHFPFQKVGRSFRTNPLFSSYERIALERTTGTPDSLRTRFFVVLNRTLAEYLKVEEPGTILFQSLLGRYEYLGPGWKESDLASYIFHWDRAGFRVPFMYKGIHPENRYKLQSNRYFTKLTNGTTIILFSRHDGLYYPGNYDVTAFREIALEYNDCDLRPEWQWRTPKKIYHPRRYAAAMDELHSTRQQEMIEDRQVYERTKREEIIRSCCKDANNRRSMRSLCSCCHIETGWKGDKWKCDLDSCARSNSSDFFESDTCDLLEMNRDEILGECCKILRISERPGRLHPQEQVRRIAQRHQVALRGFLGLSLDDQRVSRAGIDAPRNMTLWKYGCKIDNPLRFIIVDTKRSPSLARRLGVNPRSAPRVAIVDAEEERVAFMDWQFSRSRQALRLFIASFHTGELDWSPLVNGEFPQHQRADTDASGHQIPESEGTLKMKELDYGGLIELTTKTILERDAVLFLTGGVSHAASMVLNFQMYETINFFKEKNIPVDFYSFDITRFNLPYNFKMNRFPSVYFLPADRPLDSFEFPRGLQFTSSNLVYFALASLSDSVRWKALLSGDRPNYNLIRHLRARIEETERILRRRRGLSRQSVKRLASKVRASRLFLAYLHHSNAEEEFSRVLVALQQTMSSPFSPASAT
ncbi:hypothetical protein PENTCL1PPCAC_28684, partial [Pristionchus entomophagus]